MEYKKKDNFPFNFKKLPLDKIWFTSDPHFMHTNIMKYTDRKFKDVDEMNETLINNWNNVVKDDDLIFCLGDFALGNEKGCHEILKRLNGHKALIKGNHEKTVLNKSYNIDEFDGGIYERLEIRVIDEEVSNEFQDIVLSHYPMLAWNKSHRGSWSLFGHVHGIFDGKPFLSPNQLDVGVDSHNYTPISYEKVKEIVTINNLAKIRSNG